LTENTNINVQFYKKGIATRRIIKLWIRMDFPQTNRENWFIL